MELFRLIRSRPSQSPDESGIIELRLSGKRDVMRAKNLRFFELARVLVRPKLRCQLARPALCAPCPARARGQLQKL